MIIEEVVDIPAIIVGEVMDVVPVEVIVEICWLISHEFIIQG